MARIHCGNCNSHHESVAEVRACHRDVPSVTRLDHDTDSSFPEDFDDGWSDDGWGSDPDPGEPLPAGTFTTTAARPGGRPGRPVAVADRRADAAELAGPGALGRSLVIAGEGTVAAPWDDAEHVVVDDEVLADPDRLEAAVTILRSCWAERRRAVVELAVELDPEPTETFAGPVWSAAPGLTLWRDELAFLVFANAVDARDGARYPPAERAVALGATIGTGSDVVLADGTPAWVDGGPLDPNLAEHPDLGGAVLVHDVAVDVGRLVPLAAAAPDADLDPEQLAATSLGGGAARIIAPAGSGKTRVLTERARHLLRGWGLPGAAVCLVAFNVRARAEMEERTADLAGLQVRTLNSLGLAILRGTAPFVRSSLVARSPDVLDEPEIRKILDGLIDVRRRLNTDPVAVWLEALGAVRLGLRDPAEIENEFAGDVKGLTQVFDRYRDQLSRRNAVDFDEQIYGAVEVLLRDPVARAAARRACRVLLVDEFQDLTPAHLLLVRLLGGASADVFGVGDDDQTIYGHAGADPDWLVHFDRWFPGATSVALETNYRCDPGVIEAAANLLSHNRFRVAKEIRPAPDRSRGDGLSVRAGLDTTALTVGRVQELLEAGEEPSAIAVLTRVNAALAPVQVALAEADVPTTGGLGLAFLDRAGVRAALAWLRLAAAPDQLVARDIGEACRRPSRGVSPRVREWMGEQRSIDRLRALAGRLGDRDGPKVDSFADDLVYLSGVVGREGTDAALVALRDRVGLGSTLDGLDRSKHDLARASHGDDLDALIDLGRLQPDPSRFESWLRERLSRRWDAAGVQLSTIHRVKGQEWPHVVVHDVSAGVLPHRLGDDVEEERRILHVGLTRSRSTTTIVATSGSPSPFLAELTTKASPLPPSATKGGPRAGGRPSPGMVTSAKVANPDDEALRDRLRAWRRDRSKSEGVPAYVVFNDRTLDDLLSRRPRDLTALGRVHGIGPAKLTAFGEELLSVLADS